MASGTKRPPPAGEETLRKKQKTTSDTSQLSTTQHKDKKDASNDTAKSKKQFQEASAVTSSDVSKEFESNSDETTTDTSDESAPSGSQNKASPPQISNIHKKSVNPLNEIRVNPKSQYAMIIHKRDNTVQVPAQGSVLAQIKRLQRSTRLCLPKSSFARIIKEVSQKYGNYCFQSSALDAIQEAAELFTIGFISDSYLLTRHRQRQTLSAEDMQLLNNLLCEYVPSLQRS